MASMIRYFLSLVAATLLSVACGDKVDDTPKAEGTLRLSAEVLNVGYEKQTQNITVEADGQWGAYPQVDWVKTQPSGGVSGTTTLKLTIEENKTGNLREGVVEFRRGGTTYELTIKQNYDVEAVTITDERFLAALVEKYDTDGDGILSTKEASEIRRIEVRVKAFQV